MNMVGRLITVQGNVEWFSTIFDGDNVDPFPVSGASVLAPLRHAIEWSISGFASLFWPFVFAFCIDAVIKSLFL